MCTIQRKANPLGLSLFSFIIEQHRQTLDWLSTLPNVDADRIEYFREEPGAADLVTRRINRVNLNILFF